VYLVVGVVAAFLISFFLSTATNIYYLMRKKIDATDLDDVYVEEPEEPTPPAGTQTETTAAATTATTAEVAPAAQPSPPKPPEEGGPTAK